MDDLAQKVSAIEEEEGDNEAMGIEVDAAAKAVNADVSGLRGGGNAADRPTHLAKAQVELAGDPTRVTIQPPALFRV